MIWYIHYISKCKYWTLYIENSPFLLAWKLSSLGTYWMSYTRDVCGNSVLSLFILCTAYLKASSVTLSFCSSVKIAPVKKLHYTYFTCRMKVTIDTSAKKILLCSNFDSHVNWIILNLHVTDLGILKLY